MRPDFRYRKMSKRRLAELETYAEPHVAKTLKRLKRAREIRDLKRMQIDYKLREVLLHGYSVESRYRMQKGEYARMLTRQNHSCLTCNRPEADLRRRLHVDHDHRTGKVRGLLCASCNRILGYCAENPQTLRHLAAYLEFHARH